MSTDWKSMTNVERHRVSHDYWNAHDFDTFAPYFEPVIDYTEHERNIHVTSVAEMKEFATSVWIAFPDLKIIDNEYFDAGGGWTVCKFNLTGTNDGPFLGRPPTGIKVTVGACEWIHWTDKGTAQGGDMYPSFLALLVQLGLMQPPAF